MEMLDLSHTSHANINIQCENVKPECGICYEEINDFANKYVNDNCKCIYIICIICKCKINKCPILDNCNFIYYETVLYYFINRTDKFVRNMV